MVLRDVACARGSNAHAPEFGVFVTEQKITAAPFCTVPNAKPDPCDARTLHAMIGVLEAGPVMKYSHPGSDGMSTTELAQALTECRSIMETELAAVHDGSDTVHLSHQLRDVVARFAALSRQSELAPEHAVVLFKTTLHELRTTSGWPTMEREALTRELVPILIQAYYGEEDSSSR
jgi:hypothetical protein